MAMSASSRNEPPALRRLKRSLLRLIPWPLRCVKMKMAAQTKVMVGRTHGVPRNTPSFSSSYHKVATRPVPRPRRRMMARRAIGHGLNGVVRAMMVRRTMRTIVHPAAM